MTVPREGHGDGVSADLRRRVMRAVRAEPKLMAARRRSPRLPFTGALALVGVLGVFAAAGGVEFRSGNSPVRVIPASVGLARLRVFGGGGELIVTHLPPPPAGRIYQLWLQRGPGTPAPSTLFTVTSRGTADLALPGHVAGVTRVLVTVEPPGGSRAPTTRPVIVASLV
jgi:hypothetical protein